MEFKILTVYAKLGEIFSRNLNATKESQLKFEQTIKSFDAILKEFSLSLMKEQNDALKAFRASLVESATIFKAAYEQEGRSLEREKERESLIAELKKNIDEIDKEANSVILLLGCDNNSKSSAQWVAQSANILNVAATRAKKRFAIIGDLELWGKLNFFKDAKEVLDKFNKE